MCIKDVYSFNIVPDCAGGFFALKKTAQERYGFCAFVQQKYESSNGEVVIVGNGESDKRRIIVRDSDILYLKTTTIGK